MILVQVSVKDGKICRLEVSGHAGYAPKGRDLVCAGVSTVMFGLCNAADQMIPGSQIEVLDDTIIIAIPHPDTQSDMVMRTGLIQLKTAEESAEDFIQITTMEV